MSQRVALISGVSGQDGRYLAELLLAKGYRVHGFSRSSAALLALKALVAAQSGQLQLHVESGASSIDLARRLADLRPDEIYHLAAQSQVAASFATPESTFDGNAQLSLRWLEAIRRAGLLQVRFYQASSSEMFGEAIRPQQDEATPFQPRSPYGVAKLAAHWQAVDYRQTYGLFISCGIAFNHESPRRPEPFVSRKITRTLARIACGARTELRLGSLDAQRDWGHARDYVQAQWRMLQQPTPDDFVIATGVAHTVRDWVDQAAAALGLALEWRGQAESEHAVLTDLRADLPLRIGQTLVRVDPRWYRPADLARTCGDPGKAERVLGWRAQTDFAQLVREMVAHDLALAEAEQRASQPSTL